jgi:hypothetical protein
MMLLATFSSVLELCRSDVGILLCLLHWSLGIDFHVASVSSGLPAQMNHSSRDLKISLQGPSDPHAGAEAEVGVNIRWDVPLRYEKLF